MIKLRTGWLQYLINSSLTHFVALGFRQNKKQLVSVEYKDNVELGQMYLSCGFMVLISLQLIIGFFLFTSKFSVFDTQKNNCCNSDLS